MGLQIFRWGFLLEGGTVKKAKMLQTVDVIALSFLTDSERELIMEVLRRDEELRRSEEQRVR